MLRAGGMHPVDVAGVLDVTRRSVELWVKAYRVGGIEGLRRKQNPGRRPKITGDQRKAIAEAALKSPRSFSYLRNECKAPSRAPLQGAWDKQDACMGDPEGARL